MSPPSALTTGTMALDDLLNEAPCGYLTFAEDGAVVEVNATLLEMLGQEREAVVGRPVEGLGLPPGLVKHPRVDIHPDRPADVRRQREGQRTGPAAEVAHGASPRGDHALGEHRQEGPVEGARLELVPQQPLVVEGDDVVCRSGGGHVLRLGHVGRP